MDSLHHTGHQAAFETVVISRQIVSHQSHGDNFLECTRYNLHRLRLKGTKIIGEYYVNLLNRFNGDLKKKRLA